VGLSHLEIYVKNKQVNNYSIWCSEERYSSFTTYVIVF
jgi:hypothetical protein